MLSLKVFGLMTIKSGNRISIPGTLKTFKAPLVRLTPVLGSSDLIPESVIFKFLIIYLYIRKDIFLMDQFNYLQFLLKNRLNLKD